MCNIESLEKDGINFAKRALQCDSEGLVDTAVFYYQVCNSHLLLHYCCIV